MRYLLVEPIKFVGPVKAAETTAKNAVIIVIVRGVKFENGLARKKEPQARVTKYIVKPM